MGVVMEKTIVHSVFGILHVGYKRDKGRGLVIPGRRGTSKMATDLGQFFPEIGHSIRVYGPK